MCSNPINSFLNYNIKIWYASRANWVLQTPFVYPMEEEEEKEYEQKAAQKRQLWLRGRKRERNRKREA